MNRAIVNRNNWSNSNTDCSTIVLHRTAIAVYDHKNQALKLNTGGWYSVTTKSRLNAILDKLITVARVFQRDFNWYLSYANQTHDFMDVMILSQGEVV